MNDPITYSYTVDFKLLEKKRMNKTKACIVCRNKHYKCSGEQPCSFCVSRGLTCIYGNQNKRGPKIKKSKLLITNNNYINNSTNNNEPIFKYEVSFIPDSPSSSSSSSPCGSPISTTNPSFELISRMHFILTKKIIITK